MSTNNGKSVFAKYIESPKKEPLEPEIIQMGKDTVLPRAQAQKLSPAQKLLDWLQYWPKPTISARDIYTSGPRSIRDRESAIDLAKILVEYGWLAHPYQIAPAR